MYAADETAFRRDDVVILAAPGDQARLARRALERGATWSRRTTTSRRCAPCSASTRKPASATVTSWSALASRRGSRACSRPAPAPASTTSTRSTSPAWAPAGRLRRQHHRALGGRSIDWRDGRWEQRRAGAGRQLCWFPDPIRGVDCYPAASPEALLLVPAFEGVERITSRVAANRRDRLTARLPMMRRPHPEGGVGAIRVEVRGRRGPARDERILGAVDRPAAAAAAVSAVAARWAMEGRLLSIGRRRPGLAGRPDPVPGRPRRAGRKGRRV